MTSDTFKKIVTGVKIVKQKLLKRCSVMIANGYHGGSVKVTPAKHKAIFWVIQF